MGDVMVAYGLTITYHRELPHEYIWNSSRLIEGHCNLKDHTSILFRSELSRKQTSILHDAIVAILHSLHQLLADA